DHARERGRFNLELDGEVRAVRDAATFNDEQTTEFGVNRVVGAFDVRRVRVRVGVGIFRGRIDDRLVARRRIFRADDALGAGGTLRAAAEVVVVALLHVLQNVGGRGARFFHRRRLAGEEEGDVVGVHVLGRDRA